MTGNLPFRTFFCSPQLEGPFLGGMNHNQSHPFFKLELLSSREIEVIKALCAGLKREEISEKLGISVLTYDGYRKNIRQKLNIRTQASWGELIYFFRRQNQ